MNSEYQETVAPVAAGKRRGKNTNPRVSFALLCTSRLMVMLDLSIVVLALPSVRAEFRVTPAFTTWAITAYAVCFGGFLLFAGRAGDLFGTRRVVSGGYALFTAASLAGGLSQSFAAFIVSRAIQGIGAALLTPSALAIVVALFPAGSSRNRALGMWAGISGVAVPLGGLLGGVLVAGLGWRWVMFLNVPIGAVSLALVPILVPKSTIVRRDARLDVPGTFLITAATILAVGVLSEGNSAGWLSPRTIVAAAGALALLVTFRLVERRSANPLVRPGFFADMRLGRIYACLALGMGGFVSSLFTLSFFLQTTIKLGSIVSGFLLLPSAVSFTFASSYLAPRLVVRIGSRRQILLSNLAMAAGFLLWSRMGGLHNYLGFELVGSVLVGAAGLSIPVYFIEAVAKLPPDDRGVGAGLLNTFQQLGAGVGLGLTALVGGAVRGLSPSVPAFLTCTAMLVFGAILMAPPSWERRVADVH